MLKALSVPAAVFTTDLEPRNDSYNPQAVCGEGEATGENKMEHESEIKRERFTSRRILSKKRHHKRQVKPKMSPDLNQVKTIRK